MRQRDGKKNEISRLVELVQGAKPENRFEKWFMGEITMEEYFKKDIALTKCLTVLKPGFKEDLEARAWGGIKKPEEKKAILKLEKYAFVQGEVESRDKLKDMLPRLIASLMRKMPLKEVRKELGELKEMFEWYNMTEYVNEIYKQQKNVILHRQKDDG